MTALRSSAVSVMGLALIAMVSADLVLVDDLIVQQSMCVGVECGDQEADFLFDTVRLKGHSSEIHFWDTSASASFPSQDWRIIFNDPLNPGVSAKPQLVFAEDTTERLVVEGAETMDVGTVRITKANQLEVGRSENHITQQPDTDAVHADTLARLSGLDVSLFRFTSGETSDAHVGFSAEAFHAAFNNLSGSGETTHLDPLDVLGVALSALKGLAIRLEAAEAKLALC